MEYYRARKTSRYRGGFWWLIGAPFDEVDTRFNSGGMGCRCGGERTERRIADVEAVGPIRNDTWW